jgi:GTP cyclohydrolase I
MEMRGIRKIGNETITTATLGVFETDKDIEDRFLRFVGM